MIWALTRLPNLVFTAHMPTFSLSSTSVLRQAKNLMGIASHDGKGNYPSSNNDFLRKSSGVPDHPDQFELITQLSPTQMDHGVTSGMTNNYLYLIIVLKSLPKMEHKPHLHNIHIHNICIGIFLSGTCVTLCPLLCMMTRLPY